MASKKVKEKKKKITQGLKAVDTYVHQNSIIYKIFFNLLIL